MSTGALPEGPVYPKSARIKKCLCTGCYNKRLCRLD